MMRHQPNIYKPNRDKGHNGFHLTFFNPKKNLYFKFSFNERVKHVICV